MRWTYNCILLASITVISASESTSEDDPRLKRDLSFIKNLVTGNLFGAEAAPETPKILVTESDNYKLFRIPGFEKILVKAVPKGTSETGTSGAENVPSDTVVEVSESDATIARNPSIAIVNSYLGTTTLNDTLFALQGVRNLLQSGVLEVHREEMESHRQPYPSVVVEPGKIVVDRKGSVVVEEVLPIPMIEGYKPVEVTRLPNLPLPTKYSYKQIDNSGVTSYTAKDNKNVIVSRTNKPMPLPSYLTSRIQEVLYLGARRVPQTSVPVVPVVPAIGIHGPPRPIPVYNVPKIQVSPTPVKVMPNYVSSGYSYKEINTPHVFLTPPPVKVASNVPGYTYNHIHNDGSVTSYTGSGQVVDRKAERPQIVIAEASKPAPLPVFLTNRIEKVAATAVAARNPNSIPHALYEAPVFYREPQTVVVEERPVFFYDHVRRLPPNAIPHNRPLYREDVHVHLPKHKEQHPGASANVPSGYSYKTVHADGSVSTYTDSGVIEEGKKEYVQDRPMFYPAKYPGPYDYQNFYQPYLVKDEICVDPPVVLHSDVNGQPEHSRPSGYSYKTVHGDVLQATYPGSGYVEHHHEANPVTVSEVATPGEYYEKNFDGGKQVMFAQPMLSQYVYKQINHNNPNAVTVADVGPVPVNGEVTVKVGALPAPKTNPFPQVNPQRQPVLPSVTPRGPNDYIYVPPLDVKEPMPIRKPLDTTGTESSHSFTHVTNEGVHTNKNGAAAFESATTAPVVKVVKTSSSTSTSTRTSTPKFSKKVRVSTTPRVRLTTTAPTTPLSLSANPIVVMPEHPTFSFKQDRADGSSITVVGDKKKVSVIEDSRTDQSPQRGAIPDRAL